MQENPSFLLEESDYRQILKTFLDMGEALLSVGAEVHRIEDTIQHLSRAYQAEEVNIFVISASIVITIRFADGIDRTQTRRILKSEDTDFTKLEQLNALSRECCREHMPPKILAEKLHEIMRDEPRKRILCAGSMLAAFSFSIFFGGNLYDGIVAGIIGALIFFLQERFAPLCMNKTTFCLFAAFITGSCIFLMARLIPVLHSDMIMIGDIMLLIPGLAMTNSIRDILLGDTISGTMRLVESCLWAGALACGFMASMLLIGG